jgi:hypothetical protein
MLILSSEQNVAIQNALINQQTQLFNIYTKAIGSSAIIGDGEIVSVTQTALNQAIQARLSSERIWRNVVAAFIAILPGYLLFIRKDKKALWMLAGALLYVALVNLRYAIIDGRTYSLASVEGATWLIVYTSTTATVAVVIGWVVLMFGLKAFITDMRRTIDITLGYIWFIIYLLALPILLNFAINGFMVKWTLPDWYTIFIGLLCLIQVIIVALVGVIMVGLMAGLGRLTRKHV